VGVLRHVASVDHDHLVALVQLGVAPAQQKTFFSAKNGGWGVIQLSYVLLMYNEIRGRPQPVRPDMFFGK
jgi:hypothetical protein